MKKMKKKTNKQTTKRISSLHCCVDKREAFQNGGCRRLCCGINIENIHKKYDKQQQRDQFWLFLIFQRQ